MYYSQFGEDRILDQIFGGKVSGLCVEVGANDGVNDSTTYYFEKLGWDCILVEPNPPLANAISQHRTARLFPCAASSVDGVAILHVADGAERSHGISGLGSPAEAHRRIAGYGFEVRSIDVPTRRLDSILEEAGVGDRPIDFISIDVEGHELEVLLGFTVARWKPTIVITEDNSCFQDGSVVGHLRSLGYVPFKRTGVNDWFAHESNTQLGGMSGRLSWQWASLTARMRSSLKRVPGVLPFWRAVKKRPRHGAE